ncbi:hypothetical protein Zmor_017966 [Zophobas morio]|uniref:Uncharacterized protein n=1 Tax=Zophobas morio TaxID=2755281 RepID=A0AA38I9N5_9CUCU|nr:hypothetical protein Zmor_017966 [Zophobas morio]
MGAGRPTVLSAKVEAELANCIKVKARVQYPCNKVDVKDVMAEYVKAHILETPFKNGCPVTIHDWYYYFMNRHPTLSFKKPEHLQKPRYDARKPDVIYNFYDEISGVLSK